MTDLKTSLTPIVTLICAGLAKYGFDVPDELVMGIILLGFMVQGYFTRDKKPKDRGIKIPAIVIVCLMLSGTAQALDKAQIPPECKGKTIVCNDGACVSTLVACVQTYQYDDQGTLLSAPEPCRNQTTCWKSCLCGGLQFTVSEGER